MLKLRMQVAPLRNALRMDVEVVTLAGERPAEHMVGGLASWVVEPSLRAACLHERSAFLVVFVQVYLNLGLRLGHRVSLQLVERQLSQPSSVGRRSACLIALLFVCVSLQPEAAQDVVQRAFMADEFLRSADFVVCGAPSLSFCCV